MSRSDSIAAPEVVHLRAHGSQAIRVMREDVASSGSDRPGVVDESCAPIAGAVYSDM